MGELNRVQKVKPICAVTFNRDIPLLEVIPKLKNICGSVDLESDIHNFSHTNYYRKEMGKNLKKVYLGFLPLIHPGRLPELKLQTNVLETSWMRDGRRQVNLDPGYVNSAKMVLASTKDYSHRLYLSDGIYGDVQMVCVHGKFQTQDWTYPDYRELDIIEFFNKVRKMYLKQKERDDLKDEL